MIRCTVVDDEPLAIEVLKRFIADHPLLELTASFTRPLDAFAFLQKNETDILFLDIQMPELSGLELVKTIRYAPAIVFTTAFRNFAFEGFELEALDYLVKPIPQERFDKTIQKYIRQSSERLTPSTTPAEESVFVNVDKKLIKVYFNDILYIEALKNYVRIVTSSKTLVINHGLGQMEAKLPAKNFLRIHRSFIINLEKVQSYGADVLHIGNTPIPIGDSYRDSFSIRIKTPGLSTSRS